VCLLGCATDAESDRSLSTQPLTAADIVDSLRALPGIASVSETGLATGGVRSITFTIEQPIDHTDPSLGTFQMRVQLRHRSETAPTVLSSTGYSLLSPAPSDSEPSYLLNGNAITLEQRFFGPSTPMAGPDGEPPAEAWKYMTVKQAADDNHHLIQTLKQIYTGPWLSTGASKGGQVSVFHYRYYPDDLVGVVAYVAPQSYSTDDPRYVDFLEHVGDAKCRDEVIALQHDVLMRRSETFPSFQSQANSQGLTFKAIGIDAAFEHMVQEFRFAFWQYGDANACSSLPQAGGSAASELRAITAQVPINLGADQNMRTVKQFETYYYQAAVELGQYGPLEQHLQDVIMHPGTYTMENYAPPVPSKVWNPATLVDIGQWVKTEGRHIIFVYGENDPWTAGAFELDPSHDEYAFVVPGGNHGAQLSDRALPPESLALAKKVLARWTGVTPRSIDADTRAQMDRGQAPFFQPSQHLRL
jgi:hypothetical protein